MGISTLNDMVFINGGTFIMGSPESEPRRLENEAQHQVTVDSFYMGKYPITQEEYKKVMGKNRSHFKGCNLPVETVSWYNALLYCNKRSKREGLTPAYMISRKIAGTGTIWDRGANGYRLPTEAEWEYACRAGTATPFNTGDNITSSDANYHGDFPYNGNPKGIFRDTTTPVGSFAPNAWGLYDMHGNVGEWCWDLHDGFVDNPTNPLAILQRYNRIYRGGSWTDGAVYLRSAYRCHTDPGGWGDDIGFRVVRP